MATAQSKLDILIAAKNNASPAINQLKGDLASLDRSLGGLAKGLGGLAAGLGVAGLVALGGAAANAAMDLSRTAAMATDVEASFKQMASAAGQSSSEMMGSLKEASRGAISDYDLMLTANRAMLLGVSDNSEKMGSLMDVARARSQAMGITTTQAFNDIVTGIGRMSPLILDNLGIVIDQADANDIYAESIGKTVAALTEQEKKQALVNAVIDQSAGLVAANAAAGDDAASKFERMDAAIANAKVALGELFAPSMSIVATDIANAAQAMTNSMERTAASGRGDWLGLIALADQAKLASNNAKVTAEDFTTLGVTADQARSSVEGLGVAGYAAGDGLTAAELKAANLTTRLAGLKAQSDAASAALAGITSSALSRLESAASAAVGAGMGAGTVAGMYTANAERIRGQIKAMQDLGLETDYINFKSQELADEAARPFNLAIEAAREAKKETVSYADTLSDAEQQANQAFDNIAGLVSGVLSGALNTGTGVDPNEVLESLGLPREDAINESARRLADIAKNGLKGQDWLGDFASDVPDIWQMIRTAQNPQEEAAYLLRDFQDGLLTAAIDKDKAKAIVKRQIMGDANMAELAQEIAAEIAAEMGIPMQQALAASQGALGVGGGGAGMGTTTAQQFTEGANANLDETNAGGTFVDKFIAQTQASYAKLKTAGGDAGKQWGNEFLATVGNSVPPALVRILTDLVTPGVISSIAQQGTLTGAVGP